MSKIIRCPICDKDAPLAFSHKIRDRYTADYILCASCDYMFVANPSWLAEAYTEPIDTTDTGYVMRNIFLSKKTLILFSILFHMSEIRQKIFLDYAAGYGMLVRIMRDYGLDFVWDDPFTENLFAQGFKFVQGTHIDAITCFECFEHFVQPMMEVSKLLTISNTIFFSTQLKPVGIVPKENWEYYGFNHGQHVSFYSKKTMETIAKKYNIGYYTDGNNLHLFSKKPHIKNILNIVNMLTKLQMDIPIRKLLESKTIKDYDMLVIREL